MYNKNRRGPKINPCGTPYLICSNLEWALLIATYIVPVFYIVNEEQKKEIITSIFGPKSSEEQKKGDRVRGCSIFRSKSSEEQKKKVIA